MSADRAPPSAVVDDAQDPTDARRHPKLVWVIAIYYCRRKSPYALEKRVPPPLSFGVRC